MCIRDRSTGDLVTVAMSDDPAELHEIDLTGLKVPEEDSDVPFLIWFINPGSGGQTGAGILKHLNERYSVDESHGAAFALTGDPKRDHKPFKPYVRDGLYFLWDVLDSYVDMKRPIRTIVAGGDGTCVWVLNALAAHEGMRARLERDEKMGPITSVVPLGTGNDMSRFLRWGEGYSSATELNVERFGDQCDKAELYMMDRWKIEMDPPPKGTVTFGKKNVSYFCNYFSIGVDGKVAQDFESCRQSCGSCFCCPCINKLWYAWHGGKCTTACTCTAVEDVVSKVASVTDTDTLDITPFLGHDAVVFANISSYGAGTDLWAMPSANDMPDAHDANDGKIELVGVEGTQQLGRAKVSDCCAHFDRLAQGSKFELVVNGAIHMQMDGEAWYISKELLEGAENHEVKITITLDHPMPMLRRSQ
eukprot:TRINITY_DN3819_c0_g1_i2.p1 TRINITY_DN3819_c0_g1~~TRINITY_DN3819_c0_g1_i2.p1  ORF type:complete len:418 (-),score=112.08 TRINITY_DN3819_c0_g1_i2:160-1413(-)